MNTTQHTPTPAIVARKKVDARDELIRRAKAYDELVATLEAIESALDGERNRFGKLEAYTCRDTEPLRLLAIKYDIGGSHDHIEQAVKVARAALAKAGV